MFRMRALYQMSSVVAAGGEARQQWHALAVLDKQDLAQEVYVRHLCVTLQQLYSDSGAAHSLRMS